MGDFRKCLELYWFKNFLLRLFVLGFHNNHARIHGVSPMEKENFVLVINEVS